jgi:hypothetical protein
MYMAPNCGIRILKFTNESNAALTVLLTDSMCNFHKTWM